MLQQGLRLTQAELLIGAYSPECSCTAQLVVDMGCLERQAAEACVPHCNYAKDRMCGAMYAVLMA